MGDIRGAAKALEECLERSAFDYENDFQFAGEPLLSLQTVLIATFDSTHFIFFGIFKSREDLTIYVIFSLSLSSKMGCSQIKV